MKVEIETVTITGIKKSKFLWKSRQEFITQIHSKQVEVIQENLENGIFLEMVEIPGGDLTMGQSAEEKKEIIRALGQESYDQNFLTEIPQHQVKIAPFFLSKCLISQAQYQSVMGVNPSHFQGDSLPVEQVSWFDAVEFCAKISALTQQNYRLPSEAEWEYACRAGTTTPFYFGNTLSEKLANYNAAYVYGRGLKGKYIEKTTEVGKYPPNAFGICDCHGNLWEWCGDFWHENYAEKPEQLKANSNEIWTDEESNSKRSIRGGSWASIPWDCRSAIRRSGEANSKFHILGFRVARSL